MEVFTLLMLVVLLVWQVAHVNCPYCPPDTPHPPCAFHLLELVFAELCMRAPAPALLIVIVPGEYALTPPSLATP
jgi:hypothetical protein